MNPLVYFEIPVADMKRARLFYERVFEVSLELREIDGNEMALFPHAEGAPGASGALARGESYVPGRAGARIYFGVSDVAAMTCPPKTDPSAMRGPTGPGWAEGGFETLDETDTTHP